MRGLVLAGLLLWASSVQAQDRAFRASLVAAVAAHGADLAITENCLGRGACVEMNPLLARFDNPVTFGAVKMGTAALTLWLTAKIKDVGHPKIATWMNVITTGLLAGVAAHNQRIAGPERVR